MTTGAEEVVQVRVMVWAQLRGIDPKALVRKDPQEDQYRVDGLPWTIPFSEWIRGKWDEWWSMCPDPSGKTCSHCYDHEAFDLWLKRGGAA